MEQSKADVLTKDEILAFLRKHKPYLEKEFGVKKVALFGSYVRGEQTVTSDIDIAIETLSPSFRNRCNLKRFLESHLQRPIDLCYFNGMRSFIKHAIEKELVYA